MKARKRIGLVAHDARKNDLVEWVKYNEGTLAHHDLCATGTTGRLLQSQCPSLDIARLKSGPLGGDQQLGAMIAEGRLDMLIFFTDPLTAMPHDVDVKALTRIATLGQVVMARNAASADFVIASSLLDVAYAPERGETAEG